MLVRFVYLAVSHAFAALRLLRMTDREKDIEILALRHQLTVLHRQLGDQRPRLRPEDRALLGRRVPCTECSPTVFGLAPSADARDVPPAITPVATRRNTIIAPIERRKGEDLAFTSPSISLERS